MLNHEQAEKRLKPYQIKNWEKARLAAVGQLPGEMKKAGFALLDRNPEGKAFKDWQKRNKAHRDAGDALQKMSSANRQRVFTALFPKLGAYIEKGWQLFQRLPYEADYDRKGFRAPTDPEAHRDERFNWVQSVIASFKNYDQDVAWCAAWTPHVSGGYYNAQQLGLLFAAAIDAGGKDGDEVFDILKQSATNEHEVGHMGRHVILGLLAASRPEGWEFVEKLLLAAQRQEGLRSVILEAVDMTHSGAFKRMLRLILEHNLLRFSSVVRAVDVWFGLQWSALTPAVLKKAVEQALRFLDDPDARKAALETEKSEALYLALWSIAFEDAHQAVAPAAKLLKDADVERRYVAVKFLEDLHLKTARPALIDAIDDEDPRIAVTALDALTTDENEEKLDLWDKVIALLGRMPAKRQMGEPLVWPWDVVHLSRSDVAGKLNDYRGKRPATDLIPYVRDMDGYDRAQLIEELAKAKNWDAATRDLLFDLAGDRDTWVRNKALEVLKKCEVTEADAQRVEALLTRKSSELRQGVLTLLRKQGQAQVLASIDRLLASKKLPQRAAALELMRQMVEKKKCVAECRQRAAAYKEQAKKLDEEEELHLEAILDVHRVRPSLNDALGLMDPAARTKPAAPVAKKVELLTAATVATLKSLDELIEKHGQTPIPIEGYDGEGEILLSNAGWRFPQPEPKQDAHEDAKKRLPLYDIWTEWYDTRGKKLLDRDGLELVRAIAWWDVDPVTPRAWRKSYGKGWSKWLDLLMNGQTLPKRKHGHLIGAVLRWLTRLHPPAGAADFLLDAVESCFAHVPAEQLKLVVDHSAWQKRQRDWRNNSPADLWLNEVQAYGILVPEAWTDAHRQRMWRLTHWRDEPAPGVTRVRPDMQYLIAGFQAGEANETDVLDQLIGPGKGRDFNDLTHLTRPNSDHLKECPELGPIAEKVKERVLDVELKRGELPTAATGPAKAIAMLAGIPNLLRVLAALGTKTPSRNTYGEGRVETFTSLLGVTRPDKDDTPEAFAQAMKQAGVTRERLLQLAFLAPDWLDHIEHTLGWPGLKEGVWWYLAHMPSGRTGVGLAHEDLDDDDFDPDEDENKPAPLSPWEKVVAERTPLSEDDRRSGAVDPAWFHKVYPTLGRKRWDALAAAAKYGCSGSSQKKAIKISDVLLGRAKKNELIAGIKQKNLKENVRLLGLIPLPVGDKREADLMTRYKVLVEYRRYARSLGPMSREDAERTATVGLENLAKTAGYRDPIRLEWEMEAKQIADLAQGPVSVTHDGVTVTLAITPEAQPEVTVKRGDKPLKNVPSDVRKNKKVAALMERRTDLKRQASRVKQTLEAMMVRGDTFSGSELRQLFAHPLLRPALERLVVLGEGIRGYPIADGQALEDHKGKQEPVKQGETLRLAHPHDLYSAGDWDAWQAHCFRAEKVQPFKQVFRELYVVTGQEKADGAASHRYAGQQVNPNQATALFGSRGWATREEITKTFHDLGIVAEVWFRHHGWTGAQVEGLTLEAIRFRKVGEYKPMPLTEVPPRIFSEVMRDGDLVVSVAHVGGVDPEASASTVQMREAIVRETCALLNISNYDVAKSHVRIDGKLGKYSVHLGSAVVHRQPGGHVCIVPVHAQHRGRLFLPFADDDPRTAEVVSKVLLLARDHEILDPSILEQLRS